MKRILFFLSVLFAVVLWQSCEKEVLPGSIYGVVTDKATGEPIKSAGVELNPGGLKTVTGSEGQFEFVDLTPGKYNLIITKTGYIDFASSTIEVKEGQTAKSDVQIEMLPPALKVVDANNKDISQLNFGEAEADVARSFNLFNDGTEKLSWEIIKTAVWIDSISKVSGDLAANGKQAIVVTIDRNKLAEGENKTTIEITSSNGSKSLTILATNNRKEISINMLECSDITGTSAVFNAEMLCEGNPKYKERGFVYSTEQQPTLDNTIANLTAIVNDSLKFSMQAVNLEVGTTYYVRAYATNDLGLVYSNNQISFMVETELPIAVTKEVSNLNIETGTAIFNGEITYVGDPAYTERGFVYADVPNPTIDATKKVVSGTGTGSFSSAITGLIEGKIYYVRAYVINAKGVAYGKDVLVNCVASMPELITNEVTNINIKEGKATFVGELKSFGDLTCIEKGFVYSTINNPTIDDTKLIVSGIELGVFRKNVTNLEEGQIYYVRSYATNNKGTVYGNEVICSFVAGMPEVKTLSVTSKNIAEGTAIFSGSVVSLGDLGYTERGFVYGIIHNPTIDDSKVTASGSGVGEFSATATSLVEGKTYYIRAYVTNSKGTVYGEEISMDYLAVMPEVTTQEITGKIIGSGVATLNGTIVSKGDPAYTQKGFVYSISYSPSIEDADIVNVSGTNIGAFSANLNNLEVGKIYYVRAFATNSKGTIYGENVTLDFTAIMPEVETVSAEVLNSSIVYLIGKITKDGDPKYTERGFIYGTMHTPTYDDSEVTKVVVENTSSTQFEKEVSISGLNNTIYYIRAYAKNSEGVSYGEIIEVVDPAYLEYIALPTFIHSSSTYRVYPDFGTEMEWEQANSSCENLTYGGYSDWFLPSKEELNTMYLNKEAIGGFNSYRYWSSTELSSNRTCCWYQNFSSGSQNNYYKSTGCYVRCIRKED